MTYPSHGDESTGVCPCCDARGAVFVEKLIAYLPLLLVFFLTWELAELAAAHLVVQRASAAAGRAAMVVLADDPAFYDGESVGDYGGKRRDDIELAAGMILSAIPRLSSDFAVDVSDPAEDFGTLDVSLSAQYTCGTVSILCGGDGTIELTATTPHVYHGARYEYGIGTDLGGGAAALTGTGGRYRGKKKGQNDGDAMDVDSPGSSSGDACPSKPSFDQCRPEYGLDKPGRPKPADNIDGPPDPYGNAYPRNTFASENNISYEAIRYRCNNSSVGDDQNVSVIRYECDDGRGGYMAAGSGKSGGTKGNHSEQNSYDAFTKDPKYNGCTIEEFYTERESCTEKCQKWFDKGGATLADLKAKTTYHFLYNNKYDKFDPKKAKEPWIKELMKACTPFNKLSKKPQSEGGVAGFDKSECERMQEWANKTDKIDGKQGRTEANMKKCLEYQQIRDDAAGQGVRQQAQKDTAQAIKDAKTKLCKKLRGTEHPTFTAMDTSE